MTKSFVAPRIGVENVSSESDLLGVADLIVIDDPLLAPDGSYVTDASGTPLSVDPPYSPLAQRAATRGDLP